MKQDETHARFVFPHAVATTVVAALVTACGGNTIASETSCSRDVADADAVDAGSVPDADAPAALTPNLDCNPWIAPGAATPTPTEECGSSSASMSGGSYCARSWFVARPKDAPPPGTVLSAEMCAAACGATTPWSAQCSGICGSVQPGCSNDCAHWIFCSVGFGHGGAGAVGAAESPPAVQSRSRENRAGFHWRPRGVTLAIAGAANRPRARATRARAKQGRSRGNLSVSMSWKISSAVSRSRTRQPRSARQGRGRDRGGGASCPRPH